MIISINAEKAFDKIQHQANWAKKKLRLKEKFVHKCS